jgi:hypothetical protein
MIRVDARDGELQISFDQMDADRAHANVSGGGRP